MRIIFLLLIVFLLAACEEKKDDDVIINANYFSYQGTKHYTPNAFYVVESNGIELVISSFIYDSSTGEYSGSGDGVDFVKLKSSYTNKLPVGTFQSYINWGDTASNFLGLMLMDVDKLYYGNYTEWEINSGFVSISESPKGYLITYEVFVDDTIQIKGTYEGSVIKN